LAGRVNKKGKILNYSQGEGKIMMLVWWLNMIGLVISAIGAYLLFKGTPRDTPDLPYSGISIIEPNPYEKSQEEVKKWQKRGENSNWGFGLVAFGFVLQIISQVFQYPF
jgi:hypothetical protein